MRIRLGAECQRDATGGGYDLWSAPVEIGAEGITIGKAEPLLQTPFDERHPAFSPDGHWLAYTFPDNGGKRQVSDAGGAYPVWSQKTHELFFRANDNRIMVASYALKGDSFTPDKPKVWSDKQLADFGIVGTVNYDVAPDGKRIAALMQAETPESRQSSNHVVFLMNFLEELRRKVPTHK